MKQRLHMQAHADMPAVSVSADGFEGCEAQKHCRQATLTHYVSVSADGSKGVKPGFDIDDSPELEFQYPQMDRRV